jgi:hypothetical protein
MAQAASSESGRSRSPNKENGSDIIPSLRGDDPGLIQPMNPKILQRATRKIDFYLIPLVGMFCMSFSSGLTLNRYVLTSRSDLLSFLVSALLTHL